MVLLVGGWPTPLKNMKVNGKDDNPYMKWKIKNVWNHQPVCVTIFLGGGYTIYGKHIEKKARLNMVHRNISLNLPRKNGGFSTMWVYQRLGGPSHGSAIGGMIQQEPELMGQKRMLIHSKSYNDYSLYKGYVREYPHKIWINMALCGTVHPFWACWNSTWNPYRTGVYPVIYIYIWLVVSSPLKNMKVSWEYDIPNIWKK